MAAVSYNEETDQALEEVLAKPQDDEITMAKSGNLKEKKFSFLKLRRIDSLNLEAGRVSSNHSHGSKENWKRTLSLAFQSIGIIYGDIGTSPLYVFSSTFPNGIKHNDDILGVLSLIIYTIILIPMLKYVFIVLRANDNGDGGTFALYSLICRYANVGLLPNQQPEDREVSTYKLETPSNQLKRAEKIKTMLESSKIWKIILFLVTILGTSMVMGDGVLTPCISVLSAISGIKGLHQDAVVGISIAIIIILFSVQRFGTDKVGFTFAPAITLWFLFISLIGLYNLITHDIKVLRAFNPVYIIDYFKRNGKDGWISLGGVVLCVTGTEAMFADLGHFSIRAIQISFSTMVFPSIVIAYIGQAAYLSKHLDHYETVFYDSIPGPLYWPQFVVAVAAAIIASQAMISGAFAIISQSLSLGCFPRVKVVHTSAKYDGQVYIPEVNFILMLACVFVTWGFKSTTKIGNAYGIAVVAVMLITTLLLTLIMLVIWKTSIWWIALFFIVFFSVEAFFFSSVLYKFVQGGYLPLAFSLVLMVIMAIWHYVHKERYMFELNNKVSSEYIKDLAKKPDVNRAPGIGLLYSELVQGIPPIFPHFVSNIPSVHSVTVLVSVKSLPIGKVALEERFLFRHVEPRDYRVYRCVVRRGYNNKVDEPEVFEAHLVEKLKEYIMNENVFNEQTQEPVNIIEHSGPMSNRVHIEENMAPARISSSSIRSTNVVSNNSSSNQLVVPNQRAEKEIDAVQKAMDHGVFYLLGEAEVVAKKDSSLFKKFVVNYAYSFLRKNFREGDKTLAIPRTRLLKVGMVYEI